MQQLVVGDAAASALAVLVVLAPVATIVPPLPESSALLPASFRWDLGSGPWVEGCGEMGGLGRLVVVPVLVVSRVV